MRPSGAKALFALLRLRHPSAALRAGFQAASFQPNRSANICGAIRVRSGQALKPGPFKLQIRRGASCALGDGANEHTEQRQDYRAPEGRAEAAYMKSADKVRRQHDH